ncbi:short-chain fatty acid transporter [Salicibibacter halophilus]|uniref:Short-chain fatty acid transporter n=1 Tax=Salicibibacter halophilus TaxID=2502791 RepID=A0A514LNX5_9BACI|nr:short-chain fatty acid transporter [Salicibibacter halophilus]QDI93151.1 short-chain fatty acid transporter [Salicibibacter halophilus]
MKSLTSFFDHLIRRYMPNAFLFAIVLTLVVYVSGLLMTDSSPVDMLSYWGEGFWDLLDFAMQMSLIVVTGYILASIPLVNSLLLHIARNAKTPGQAIMLVTFVSGIACLINYGFGLVLAALLAKKLVQVVPETDFRLLVASGYTGFLVWHGGLSGSIPLTINTPGHFLEEQMGLVPITETLFSASNLFIVLTLLFTLPIINRLMLSATDDAPKIDPSLLVDEKEDAPAPITEQSQGEKPTPAVRLENSMVISMVIGFLGMGYVVYYFVQSGLELELNIVNFTFLFLGILLHKTPCRYLNTVNEGVKNAGGIIIQFPFYAGIMGMMEVSGISTIMASFFIDISTEFTYPLFTFLSAGLLNFFVPSGGGGWAVQGPIMIEAGMEIGVDNAKTAVAAAWGDAWTNMIQPFWALPLLAIAGLSIRDIMGFCVIALLWSFIPITIGLLFL